MTTEHTASKIGYLPGEPNAFVGRERDVADLCRMVEATRCVSLCGPGGIGKTRLALRVGRDLADMYEDGVWFAELADLIRPAGSDADPVTWRVASLLGVAEEGRRPLQDTLADALGHREMLLILDNCEHLVEECAGLARILLACCPRVRLLTTTREPLRMPGENIWRVPPLSVPRGPLAGPEHLLGLESVRLFEARAQAVHPGFEITTDNAPALARLCRELDGLPLALELAAARVRVLTVEQIADRLADRFRLLSAGDRTAPQRQRTLRAAIDWSYELLAEPERILLRRLSIFAGWTLEQAEEVCCDALLDQIDILDCTTALVDKSLVVVDREVAGHTRFRLLDSIRRYAAERLAESGEEEALGRRHRDAVLEAAELDCELALAGRRGTWAQRMTLFQTWDHQMDNLRSALAWSLAHGDTEEGLRMATALRSYGLPRGYLAECQDWAERFLALPAEGAPPAVRGAALVGLAEVTVEHRDFQRAAELAAEGIPLCRAARDDTMTAAGLTVLGSAEVSAGRFDEADEHLTDAVRVADAAGDLWNEALALISMGALHGARGRLRECQETLERSLRLMREIDQLWGGARVLLSLGLLARIRGDHAGARRHYEEALPILRGITAGPEIARCLGGIGRAAVETGDLHGAREALAESLRLSRSLGLRIGMARGLDAFATLVAREGDMRRAVLLAGSAAALTDQIGHRTGSGARMEKLLEPARRKLGEQTVAQLWGEGRALTADAALDLALEAEPVGVPAQRAPLHDREPAAPVTPPSTLTAREREIARLISRGLSNKGIADELVISPATVARHVTNVLTKLGFGSRAQIAAWAVDHGLTGDTDV